MGGVTLEIVGVVVAVLTLIGTAIGFVVAGRRHHGRQSAAEEANMRRVLAQIDAGATNKDQLAIWLCNGAEVEIRDMRLLVRWHGEGDWVDDLEVVVPILEVVPPGESRLTFRAEDDSAFVWEKTEPVSPGQGRSPISKDAANGRDKPVVHVDAVPARSHLMVPDARRERVRLGTSGDLTEEHVDGMTIDNLGTSPELVRRKLRGIESPQLGARHALRRRQYLAPYHSCPRGGPGHGARPRRHMAA